MQEETIDNSSLLEILHQVVADNFTRFLEFSNPQSEGFKIDLADPFYRGGTAQILERRQQFSFYIDFVREAPEDAYERVTEFITRANREIPIGNLQMDYDDGSVCFRFGLDFKKSDLSYNLIWNGIRASIEYADLYKQGLVEAMFDTMSATDEIQEEEGEEESAMEAVYRALVDEGFHPQEFVPESSIGFVMELADRFYHGAIAHILEDTRQFVFYIDFRPKSTELTHAEVTEFITQANRGLLVGNFELDYEDGNVRFRSALCYEGGELSYYLARSAINAARENAETYKQALLQVISGKKTATEALAEVEE